MPTIANEFTKAALDGGLALVSGGNVRFAATGDVELATLPISAVGAATTASPSVSVLSLTPDTTVTAGTIVAFAVRTSGNAARISGTVGTSGTDLVVTDNVIPSGATEVSAAGGLSISLTLT